MSMEISLPTYRKCHGLVGDAGNLRFILGVAEDEAVLPAVLRQPDIGGLPRDVHGQTHLMLTGAGDGYSFQRLFPGFIEVKVKFLMCSCVRFSRMSVCSCVVR